MEYHSKSDKRQHYNQTNSVQSLDPERVEALLVGISIDRDTGVCSCVCVDVGTSAHVFLDGTNGRRLIQLVGAAISVHHIVLGTISASKNKTMTKWALDPHCLDTGHSGARYHQW